MTMTPIIKSLDSVLKPLGFVRRKRLWNRRAGSFLDVLDVQVRKAGDAFTINVGVLDPEVYQTLWGEEPEAFVEQPRCTICVRIGELIDGHDKWWQIEGADSANDATEQTMAYVAPFLDRMHDRNAMRRWLAEGDVEKKRYPPPIISLALLEKLLGNGESCHERLERLRKTTSEPWQVRIGDVIERLRAP